MPVFTGTSHAVLSDLFNVSASYGKVHLALNSLSIENAQRLLMNVLKKKSPSLSVHETWLTKTNQSSDSIVPMDILTGEVLRIPSHVSNTLPKLCLKAEFKKYFEKTYTIQHLKKVFVSLKSVIEAKNSDTFKKGMNIKLMLVIATGYYLYDFELENIGYNNISALSILNQSKKDWAKYRVLIMPALVNENIFFPLSFQKILEFEYLESKLTTTVTQGKDYNNLFNELNADRIGMMFELFKVLGTKHFTFNQLFGESCVLLSSSSIFKNFLMVPERSLCSNELYKIDFKKPIFTTDKETNSLCYDAKTLHDIDAEKDKEIKSLFNCGVGLLTSIEKNAVSDIVVLLKSIAEYNLILSISVLKGSEIGDSEGSFALNRPESKKKLLRDVKAIATSQNLNLNKTKHCLVYITSCYHSEEDIASVRRDLEENSELQAMLKAADIGVVLVHDMDDYLPLIAHRLRIEVSSSGEQKSSISNI
jgi:hypothetical protein